MKATLAKGGPKKKPSPHQDETPQVARLGLMLRRIGVVVAILSEMDSDKAWQEYRESVGDKEWEFCTNHLDGLMANVSRDFAAAGGFGRLPE